MKSFIHQLASKNGRIGRAILGLLLIVVGLVWPTESVGWVIVIIGLIPIAAAALDLCLVAALFGLPIQGKELRK
jgi:hypothetical protein